MSAPLFGAVSWLGYRLPLAVPAKPWFDGIESFTGLEVEREGTPTTAPVLSVVDDRHVPVDDQDLRTFSDRDTLKAWLFLTVSDVMISRGGFTALHAAGFAMGGHAVLVSGPPCSGKSSWAFAVQRRGAKVLGDDQVSVDPQTGLVHGLPPRPLKRRLAAGPAEQHPTSAAVRARLDDESIALKPRRTTGCVPVDRGYPVARIIHLARHRRPGVEVEVLDRFRPFRSILDQTRTYARTFLADAAASARILGRLPNFRVSVGEGQIERALDIVWDLN
jgi:hypothetical protein